jgi:hypothetical protein
MTPAELIRPIDPAEQADFDGATHALVEDFRADFPAVDSNGEVVVAMKARVPVDVLKRLNIDWETSALYAYGTLEDLQVALNALQAMKGGGFGQVEPPKLTIGQAAARDRIQDLLAAMVVQGHDPDDITVGLKALGYG